MDHSLKINSFYLLNWQNQLIRNVYIHYTAVLLGGTLCLLLYAMELLPGAEEGLGIFHFYKWVSLGFCEC